MSRKYTEEELNDPNLFAKVSEEEKQQSFERAKKLENEYESSNKNPIDLKLRRKNAKKPVEKVKFATIKHDNNKDES